MGGLVLVLVGLFVRLGLVLGRIIRLVIGLDCYWVGYLLILLLD